MGPPTADRADRLGEHPTAEGLHGKAGGAVTLAEEAAAGYGWLEIGETRGLLGFLQRRRREKEVGNGRS